MASWEGDSGEGLLVSDDQQQKQDVSYVRFYCTVPGTRRQASEPWYAYLQHTTARKEPRNASGDVARASGFLGLYSSLDHCLPISRWQACLAAASPDCRRRGATGCRHFQLKARKYLSERRET